MILYPDRQKADRLKGPDHNRHKPLSREKEIVLHIHNVLSDRPRDMGTFIAALSECFFFGLIEDV